MTTPKEFMELVWPATGPYCLATPFVNKDGKEVFAHYACDDVDDAIAMAMGMCFREKKHVFFAIHSIKLAKIKDMNGKLRTRRTHDNMNEGKAFFFDLDVGDSEKGKPRKFKTQQDAWNGLDRFLFRTGLPEPYVISSGGGLHVYWIIDDPLASLEWRKSADKLRHLAETHGLLFDPSRTVDQSSVLRVPGTRNYKLEGNPRPVKILREGTVTPTDDFLAFLDKKAQDYTPLATMVHQMSGETGNLQMDYGGRITPSAEVFDICEHMRVFRDSNGEVSEPHWYVACGTLMWAHDGEALVHDISAGDPRYDEDETQTKIEQWRDKGPPTCAKINLSIGGDVCKACQFSGQGRNPLDIANKIWETTPKADPPKAALVSTKRVWVKVCDVRLPFQRNNAGVGVIKQDAANPNVSKVVNFLTYDLFPIEQFSGNSQEPGYSRWVVDLPLEGQRLFTFETNNFSTTQQFTQALLNTGIIVPDPNDQTTVRKYMLHYLRDLQRHTQTQAMYDHLGWIYNDDDPDVDTGIPVRFVMCGEALDVGKAESVPCAMSSNTDFLKAMMRKRGTMEKQIENLKFYNKTNYYRAHRFIVLCALAAPFLRALGHHGLLIAIIGESGRSKSTALELNMSMWGDPVKLVINGTPAGATPKAREDMIMALANLPVCIDELTLDEPETTRELVMSLTQATGRDTMTQDRKHRKHRGGVRSTITCASSNNSVHQKITMFNTTGQAAIARVLEFDIGDVLPPHTKIEADAFRHQMKMNFGHIGPAFMAAVVPVLHKVDEKVREEQARIDVKFSVKPEERFYSAAAACVLTAGRIAFKLGMHPFDIDDLEEWFGEEVLPAMRARMAGEIARTQPHEIVGNFLDSINGETLKIELGSDGNLGGVLIQPHGAISARLDITANEVWIRSDRFARYCRDNGYNRERIVKTCLDNKLFKKVDRRTLTAGLETRTLRTSCYILDLAHKKAKGIAK